MIVPEVVDPADGTTGGGPPSPRSVHPLEPWANRLAMLLDEAFVIPGTNIRFGFDPILGLLAPGVGDFLAGLVSLALVFLAVRHRVPGLVIARMLLNIAIDTFVGVLPGVGDVADLLWRSNAKNRALLDRYRAVDPPRAMSTREILIIVGVGVIGLILVILPIFLVGSLLVWAVLRWSLGTGS